MMKSVCSLVAALVVGVFSGCSSIGGGAPSGQAQVVISGHPEGAISMKAEEVFYRHGFSYKGGDSGRLIFERAGGTIENVLYGNWQGKDTYTRVSVFVTRQDHQVYALRARSVVVRDTFGETVDEENFDVQGARYGVLLKKIKAEL